MFERVLIANRGEIACRIAATCRRLGIESVGIHSDADRAARHRFATDLSIAIGGDTAAESYLDTTKVLDAARATGAQAIHPGYGFLSENAGFARACADAGIVFIGPSPDTIDAMGSKSDAKRTMEGAGVPCVPGYHDDDQDDGALAAAAERIGFPLLIKASAGGGGKGMRIVRDAAAFATALAGARREARGAFGDDRVLLERFIDRPRHIEFQVFGDTRDGFVHLFERECSLQRRYQKIVEESPSPFLDEGLRRRMGEAAIAAARAVAYTNAGTVEFLVAPNGEFFFMEMNTRLQVEHPVTELVTGLDLVEWQLRVAAGEPLPLPQDRLRQAGHAIEVRLYAENTEQDFLPATGRISRFLHPVADDVRVDSGVADGDTIGPLYDPMIAKLCVYGSDRAAAAMRLREVLGATVVFGLTTNLPLLRAVAAHDDFASGATDTGWIEREIEALRAWPGPPDEVALAAAAHGVRDANAASTAVARPHDPGSPWLTPAATPTVFTPRGKPEPRWIAESPIADRLPLESYRHPSSVGANLRLATLIEGNELLVTTPEGSWELERRPPFARTGGTTDDEAHPGAPMPGRIVAIHCKPGDRVTPGQPLLVLEAMKMEYTLTARTEGVIAAIRFAVGDMVDAEVPLVDLEGTDLGSDPQGDAEAEA